jgi:hypothetical protein
LRALSEGQGSAFANRYAVYEKGKTVAIYHCSIKIISRGKGRSAVACAAYRSGTKLTDLATGKIFDYSNKPGVVFSEVLLPENAPAAFAVDRNILWDAVERKETRSDARLAREVEVALPREFTRQEQIDTVREYIIKNFVREGMCADWALHDKRDGNPHAHIMLTTRAFTRNGKWAEKSRTIYKLDPNGQKVPLIDPETGEQKVRVRKGKGVEKLWQTEKVPANDWNDRSKAEEWRAAWATECNRRLDRQHQIDHRSYARQAVEQEPTIHEGYAARKMESEGRVSDRCEINRETKALNEQHTRSLEVANGELYNAASEHLRLYRDVIRDLESESKELSGAIQQAEDAERALSAPVERCKPWERAKRKEQAEQRENALQKRTEAFAALYELGCATIEAAKSLLQSILQRIRQLRQEQAELRADLERLGEELPIVKHASDLLQPAASAEQIGVRERLQAIRQQREAERKAHAEWVEQQRRANMQREQPEPERSPQETPDDAAAQQEQKVRSVADFASRYREKSSLDAADRNLSRVLRYFKAAMEDDDKGAAHRYYEMTAKREQDDREEER